MKKKRTLLSRLLLASAFLVQCMVTLGKTFWVFELFTHYAPYYALIALGCSLFYFYKKERLWAACWATLFAINLIPIWPYLTTVAPLNSPSLTSYKETDLTLFAQNVYFGTTDTSEFFSRVDELQPTIFVVNEASDIWGTTQSEVLRDYPYTAITQKTGVHGIFMGSQVAGTFTEIPLGHEVGLEFIPEDDSYRVLGVHPAAPLTSSWASERNAQFEDLNAYMQSSELPTVIIGDFNCTPWSPYFKELLNSTTYSDARLGFGFKSTWKANSPLFWLPIDHALLSPGLTSLDFETYPTALSDHKGIGVKVSF